MDSPTVSEARFVAPDTEAFAAYAPVPGYGTLPTNAYLIRGEQPLLVDTGVISMRDQFMDRLRSAIDLRDLRWLWLTHTDPDHIGSLRQILEEAPKARVITTYLGMGKMNLYGLPIDRVYLLNPGQTLDIGDRELQAVKPPSFDAPESTGFVDKETEAFFCVDCFGALLQEPAETAADIDPDALRDGMITWATVDAPWLTMVRKDAFAKSLDTVRKIEPSVILSSHLPPAEGMTETLLTHLESACSSQPFVGPDQAALEQMMAQAKGG